MNKVEIFYDQWCGPSNQLRQGLKPLKGLEKQYIHIESNPAKVRDMKIVAIPTTILYDDNGNVLRKFVGYSSKLIEILKEYE